MIRYLIVFLALAGPSSAQTFTVSTANSPWQGDYVGDGVCDEVQINAAIAALPPHGGEVRLASGTYGICQGSNPLGGVVIARGNVVLSGEGKATYLRLANYQHTNVIRVQGAGRRDVVIRDLACDGNWDFNTNQTPETRFEVNCIRAGGSQPAEWQENVIVERIHAEHCPRLCVMLFGAGMVVRDSTFGEANSDIVEILGEGGAITGNIAVIDEPNGHVFGGDAQNDLLIASNRVIIKAGGSVDPTIFRTYGEGLRHTILANNIVRIEEGGSAVQITDLRSYLNTIEGNIFDATVMGYSNRPPLKFNGGTTVSGNVLQNVYLWLHDTGNLGAIASGNVFGGLSVPSNMVDGGNHRAY